MASSAETIYYTASDGERWRVYDCVFSNGHRRIVPIGDVRASTRYFTNAFHVVRETALKQTESRAVDFDTLAHHFAQAGFVAQTGTNAAARHPR